ncbi:hypothetical protein CP532_1040 [Ophiocordyceps camponoti-leonardi (nom. inval.)]|nr:hypothetical protein CP532_1040 [Ophiocordyceps camponoti-leonardi (nom. inval.)]
MYILSASATGFLHRAWPGFFDLKAVDLLILVFGEKGLEPAAYLITTPEQGSPTFFLRGILEFDAQGPCRLWPDCVSL